MQCCGMSGQRRLARSQRCQLPRRTCSITVNSSTCTIHTVQVSCTSQLKEHHLVPIKAMLSTVLLLLCVAIDAHGEDVHTFRDPSIG